MSWQALIPFFAWLGATPFAMWLGQSTARIAMLFTFHLFGLVLMLGSIVVLSLRLLGLALTDKPVKFLARFMLPFAAIGMALMILTGSSIFIGGASDYWAGPWFRLKMVLLACALIYHFAIFRRVTLANEGSVQPVLLKLTGLVALLIWFAVGWAGRSIAFF